MQQRTASTRTLSLALLCLVLQLLWVAGFGAHSVCIEADGDHHAEWSGLDCAASCEFAAAGAAAPPGGLMLHDAPPCGDCTDLVITQSGLRSHHSETAAPLLPVAAAGVTAWPPAAPRPPRARNSRPPLCPTDSALLPLRC